ncbi:hypothetical protein EO95_02125 [Methanosarcina sp. 1.H.T.1A.1]|uniref:pentapeptide repeat-containing protein n=1 Tax=Methanosarcina sp. 1.H.T.1A.1 TaxID=1483602 RepID=UPI0006221DC2|nr:pentapeptide repeat-containing protein [Methanosarcina sp. 1.H.T.1A.1]KKH97988.1 hypothetical protein EO95_02125 [Methanosarcina sp. 1.H.T.1A.1]
MALRETYENARQHKLLIWVTIVFAVSFVLIALFLSYLVFTYPVNQVFQYGITNATEKANLINQYRTTSIQFISTLAQILGGGAVAVGIYFAWGNLKVAQATFESNQKNAEKNLEVALVNLKSDQETSRKSLEIALATLESDIKNAQENLIVAKEGQITERFTRAIEQLGGEKIEIRLGGIYALERISKESEKDYWPIMEILTAYIRNNSSIESENIQTVSLDIQAILTVIGRRKYFFISTDSDRLEYNCLDLRRTNLRRANIEKAHLRGAIFIESDLRETNLQGANLESANLREANLEGAHLRKAYLKGAYLEKANCVNASIGRAYLESANLREANLKGAHLRKAYLKGTYLEKTNLKKANLEATNLEGAILKGADLREADLQGADLKGAILEGSDIREAKLGGAILEEAFLVGAILEGAHLGRAILEGVIKFGEGANLLNAYLKGANLKGVDFEKANLEGADLEGADLEGAKNLTVDQLSKVKTLYNAKFDEEFKISLQEKYPALFEKPDE